MSLPNYQHILKSSGSRRSVEKTVEGAARCLLSRAPRQNLDSDMTCPYYPHHLKLGGAQWHPVTIKGLRSGAQQVLWLEVSSWKTSTVSGLSMWDTIERILSWCHYHSPLNASKWQEWLMPCFVFTFASVSTWAYNVCVCMWESDEIRIILDIHLLCSWWGDWVGLGDMMALTQRITFLKRCFGISLHSKKKTMQASQTLSCS